MKRENKYLKWKQRNNNYGGKEMTVEDRRLMVETLAEMKELKGEMREFKEHVVGRVEKLEKKESERNKDRISVTAILISAVSLVVTIIVNFFKHGGK